MKKIRIAPAERVFGILLGILLALTVFFVGVVNVLKSQSFYLGQDKRYTVTTRMSLKNADQFRDVYHSLQAAFEGKTDFNITLYRRAPEESKGNTRINREQIALWQNRAQGEVLWSDSEEAFLHAVGSGFLYIKWITAALYLPLIAWLIVRLKKRGRSTMLGIGWYAVFASALTAILLNLLLAFYLPQTDLLSSLSGGLWLRAVFSPETQKDLLSGIQWFFDFLMLIPLGVGTILIKLSVKKENDPNEDYLYQ